MADFLIGAEAERNGAVGNLLFYQSFAGGEDLRDPRLVIRPQQGAAVGDDQVMADLLLQIRELLRAQHPAMAQRNLPAVVMFHHPGLHVFPAKIRGRVYMGDQADGGAAFIAFAGREEAVDIAALLPAHPLQPQRQHFFLQPLCQRLLAGSAGGAAAVLIALGIDFHIVQKPLPDFHALHLICRFLHRRTAAPSGRCRPCR